MLQSVVLLSRSGWELRSRLLVLVGDASYTLYLLHLFVLSAWKHVVAHVSPVLQSQRPLGALAVMAISTGCAIAVYVYLERPVHRGLNRLFLTPHHTGTVPPRVVQPQTRPA